jgi:hypothetical protein
MTIKVYGEMHFFIEEVDEIRSKIVDDEPTIILLENMEDSEYYKKNTKAKVYRLEPEYRAKGETLLKQFLTREKAMIATIKAVIKESSDNDIICIQVGDTHLRTIYTKELGLPTLNQYLVTIDDIEVIRSKHGEIK